MNDYDNRALEDIRAWQGRKPSRRLRNAIPESVRERAGELVDRGKEKAGETFDDFPGSERVKQALLMTLEGATRTIGAGAAASVLASRVIRRYRKAGHSIERIEDIQDLELAASDRVFPRRKRLAYVVTSGAEGGVAGAATTVAGAATVVTGVFAAGAGGVPTGIVTAAPTRLGALRRRGPSPRSVSRRLSLRDTGISQARTPLSYGAGDLRPVVGPWTLTDPSFFQTSGSIRSVRAAA